MAQLPPLPVIENLNMKLPERTDPVIIGTTPLRLNLFADSDNSSRNTWVSDIPGEINPQTNSVLQNYWDGNSPLDYTLTLRHYWRLVESTYSTIHPGMGYTKSYILTHGVTAEDAQTLSAELGVEASGLSAKLQATFLHSLTVTDQTQESTEYTVGAPDKGLIRVWALYQLIEEIVALDLQGNVIPESDNRRGDVGFSMIVPMYNYKSGAYLQYKNVQQLFPTTIYSPVQQDFAG